MAEDLTMRVTALEVTLGHTMAKVEALRVELRELAKALLVFSGGPTLPNGENGPSPTGSVSDGSD